MTILALLIVLCAIVGLAYWAFFSAGARHASDFAPPVPSSTVAPTTSPTTPTAVLPKSSAETVHPGE